MLIYQKIKTHDITITKIRSLIVQVPIENVNNTDRNDEQNICYIKKSSKYVHIFNKV